MKSKSVPLRNYLLYSVGTALSLLMMILTTSIYFRTREVLTTAVFQKQLQLVENVADRVGEALDFGNWGLIERTVKPLLLRIEDVASFYVYDADLNIKVASTDALLEKSAAEIARETKVDSFASLNLMILGSQNVQAEVSKSDRLYVNVPLSRYGKKLGGLAIAFSESRLKADLKELQLQSLALGIGLILATLFILWWLTGRAVSPLVQLSDELSKFRTSKGYAEFIGELEQLNPGAIQTPIREIEALRNSSVEFKKHLVTSIQKIMALSKEAAQANEFRAIAQTTQMIAHDIRAPFSQLKMALTLLKEIKSADEVKHVSQLATQEIEGSLRHVDALLQDILEFGREHLLATNKIDLRVLVDDVIAMLRKSQDLTSMRLEIENLSARRVIADEARIKRVFLNIVCNAIQATKAGGRIWIKTREFQGKDNGVLEVCIGNEGSYISSTDAERIFDAFFTKGKTNGTGLGLAIAKKIVVQHGGDIWCRSDIDSGTEFFFTLPAERLSP